MANPSISINSLPNEIILQVLGSFPTALLFPLAPVCRRFRDLVLRLHYARLVEAATLPDHDIVLSSTKIPSPYLFCDYIGTDGLAQAGLEPNVLEMCGLYSRFRPVFEDETSRPRGQYPVRSPVQGSERPFLELASHKVRLDVGELFSQLCTIMNVVKLGPKEGLFLSCVSVFDGVIKLWRNWLATERTAGNKSQTATLGAGDSDILWIDQTKDVGLRLRVTANSDLDAPVPAGSEDEPLVSYTLEYEELLIRTHQLVINLEKSEAQQVTSAGKAIVIAST